MHNKILFAYFETTDTPETLINTWPISNQLAQFSPIERLRSYNPSAAIITQTTITHDLGYL